MSWPIAYITVVFILSSLFAVPTVSFPYHVDSLFCNYQFYGPILQDGNWNPRPMTLIDDFIYQINITLDVNSPFLLVNLMSDGVKTKQKTKCALKQNLNHPVSSNSFVNHDVVCFSCLRFVFKHKQPKKDNIRLER